MKAEFRVYGTKKYEYGWMVISTNLECTDERMVYCYANREAAEEVANKYNQNEPMRYAAAKEAEKRNNGTRFVIGNEIDLYYRNRAYSGD